MKIIPVAKMTKLIIVPTSDLPSDDDAVVDAFYPFPNLETPNQDLKDATANVMFDAGWGVSEGTRQKKE